MKILKQTIKTSLLLALMMITSNVDAQQAALDISRRMADKVIRETRFEYELVPMTHNAGITRFTMDQNADTESISYAYSCMKADEETQGFLGLSYSGQIAVFLNKEKVFEGSSDHVELQQYTYDRYHFTEKIPVKWTEGKNTLLVKCATGSAGVILM